MYKTVQEFSFTIKQNEKEYNFIGQLIFKSSNLNVVGTLHTDYEIEVFNGLLNASPPVPDYWTLELVAKHIFDSSKHIFSNLYGVAIFNVEAPQRVSEYTNELDNLNDILELNEIG